MNPLDGRAGQLRLEHAALLHQTVHLDDAVDGSARHQVTVHTVTRRRRPPVSTHTRRNGLDAWVWASARAPSWACRRVVWPCSETMSAAARQFYSLTHSAQRRSQQQPTVGGGTKGGWWVGEAPGRTSGAICKSPCVAGSPRARRHLRAAQPDALRAAERLCWWPARSSFGVRLMIDESATLSHVEAPIPRRRTIERHDHDSGWNVVYQYRAGECAHRQHVSREAA